MNRHFANYFPADHILGQTVPPKQERPQEPAWQPAFPGYERRTVNGKGEIRPVPGSLPERSKPATTSCAEQAAEPATAGTGTTPASTPDSVLQWNDGAPPERGWYVAFDGVPASSADEMRFWDGEVWSRYASEDTPPDCKLLAARERTALRIKGWRGPRLTGPNWPEPNHD